MEQTYPITYFPRQKISTNQKTKEWFKKCVDAAINSTVFSTTTSNRKSRHSKQILRNLANGIVDPNDIEKTTTYADFQQRSMYETIQNYPLSKPRIDLLVGESASRRFDWMVRVLNDDSISEKEEMIKDRLMQIIGQSIQNVESQEELDKQLRKLERWKKFELQDIRERRASHILTHLYSEQKMNLMFMRGMDNALVEGEEIYCVDIVGGEPIVREVNPLDLHTIRTSSSPNIEDSDIIVEDNYQPIGYIIDTYYDYLTSTEIDKIEKGVVEGSDNKDGDGNPYMHFPSSMFADADDPEFGNFSELDNPAYGTPYDEEGNIRHTRVVWRSLRKLGKIVNYDEEGIPDVKIVSEMYEPNEEMGEKVEWFWVNEWMEATRLGHDIYVKMQPRPIQFRRMDNLSAGGSGYVGTVYPESLMEIMKPYQYMYMLIWDQLKKALKTFRPPMVELDIAKIPDDWSLEDWFYYAQEKGWVVVDTFKEGKKGAAMGKLAGMNNTTGKIYNPDMSQYINSLFVMLQFIEAQVETISGVSKQRMGQIENRETVGGIERSVSQSSHVTEKIFMYHDNTKVRVLETLLETAKFAWRDKRSKKVQYVLDDLSTELFEIDGQQFNESEYGVFVTNTTNDTMIFNSIKEIAQNMASSGSMKMRDLMTILSSPSISIMRRQLEESEDERDQQEQQNFQAQQEAANAAIQQKAAADEAKLQIERENNIRDNETKLLIADKNAQEPETKEDNSDIEMRKHNDTIALKAKELNEKKRHNMATESISRITKKSPSKS